VLVADDQLIQQPGILALQPCRYGKILLPRLFVNCGGGTLTK
jgi:hypothetical protein